MSCVSYRFVDTSFCELPGDDHLTFVPSIVLVYHPSLEVELLFIGSELLFNMDYFTFREFADMMLLYSKSRRYGRAARQLYKEHFPHRQTHSHALFAKVYQWASGTGTFTASRFDCGAPRRRPTPELEEAVLHAVEEDVTMCVDSMWISKLFGVFCIILSYTRTTPREYRQCDQGILCQESTSADGSCTVVLMNPSFHGGSSPLMRPSSPGNVL